MYRRLYAPELDLWCVFFNSEVKMVDFQLRNSNLSTDRDLRLVRIRYILTLLCNEIQTSVRTLLCGC